MRVQVRIQGPPPVVLRTGRSTLVSTVGLSTPVSPLELYSTYSDSRRPSAQHLRPVLIRRTASGLVLSLSGMLQKVPADLLTDPSRTRRLSSAPVCWYVQSNLTPRHPSDMSSHAMAFVITHARATVRRGRSCTSKESPPRTVTRRPNLTQRLTGTRGSPISTHQLC